MMDISQTTFTQHLRAAENKLFAALFDDTVTVS
jgi:predicted DNA binding protein